MTYTYTITARNPVTGEVYPLEISTGDAIHVRVYARRPWWYRAWRRIHP